MGTKNPFFEMSDQATKKAKTESAGETEISLEECKKLAVDIARECGILVRSAYKDTTGAIQFKGSVDLVTETDQNVEKVIFKAISEKYPNHKLIGEETVAAGGVEELTDEPTWIVDPIDGTTNFVHRIPWFGISIGFAVGKEILLGVVYNPILDEMFTAVSGGGAFLNDRQLTASSTTELKKSLVATGFSYDRRESSITFHMNKLHEVMLRCRDMRRIGSAALDMCAVAAGRLDAYYEQGIHVWDIAAATLIVREAGGVVCDPYGGDCSKLNLSGRGVFSSCKGISEELVALLKSDNPPDLEK